MKIEFRNGRPSRVKNYGGDCIVVDENRNFELLFTEGNGEKLYTTFAMRNKKYNEKNGYVHSGYVPCHSLKAFKRHLRKYCANIKDAQISWYHADSTQDRVVHV